MTIADSEKPSDFTTPTLSPKTCRQAEKWQRANLSWWQKHPMYYGWKKGIECEEFSREFYAEIDRRFFSDIKIYLPWKRIPFDLLIDFASLRDKRVLEIGVGLGSAATLLAQHARSFTGIDITDYAVKSTQERMRVLGLKAQILQMDAEHLGFGDNTFDFIWTWGAIHHSANTSAILGEAHRVLKPQGKAVVMVYRRGLWNYYVTGMLFGIFRRHFLKTRSLHKIMQNETDGAIARFYSLCEWKALTSKLFCIENILTLGRKSDIVLLPAGRVKDFVYDFFPDDLIRFFANRCGMGGLLVSALRKTTP